MTQKLCGVPIKQAQKTEHEKQTNKANKKQTKDETTTHLGEFFLCPLGIWPWLMYID
jgi:hypothetical protein